MELVMRLVGYARVSTKKDDQRHSFDSQVHYFRNEVVAIRSEYKNGYMVDVYADEGLTATKFIRKHFLRMVHDAGVDIDYKDNRRKKGKMRFEASSVRKPLFDRILVTNISRLSRDVVIIDILRELVKKNVYVDFLENNWTTEEKAHWMFIEMFFSFSEQESRDRSLKVSNGLEKTARRGKLFSVHNLYGYNYHNMELTINENEAQIVRTIFEMYAAGVGTRKIIKHLTDNEHFTRAGEPFSDATLRGMLKNEKYCGLLYRNKWKHGEIHIWQKKEKKPKEEWIIPVDEEGNVRDEHTNKIPAIINEELFNEVQLIRNKKISSETRRGVNTGASEYSRMIFCRKCGSSLIKSARYKKTGEFDYTIYKCAKKKNGGKTACDLKDIRGEYVEQAIDKYVKDNIEDRLGKRKAAIISKLEQFKIKTLEKINVNDSEAADNLKSEIATLEEQKKRIAVLFATGSFSEDQLKEMIQDVEIKIEETTSLFKEASLTNEDILELVLKADNFIKRVNDFQISIDKSVDVFEHINKITVLNFKPHDINEQLLFQFHDKIFDELFSIVKELIRDEFIEGADDTAINVNIEIKK